MKTPRIICAGRQQTALISHHFTSFCTAAERACFSCLNTTLHQGPKAPFVVQQRGDHAWESRLLYNPCTTPVLTSLSSIIERWASYSGFPDRGWLELESDMHKERMNGFGFWDLGGRLEVCLHVVFAAAWDDPNTRLICGKPLDFYVIQGALWEGNNCLLSVSFLAVSTKQT